MNLIHPTDTLPQLDLATIRTNQNLNDENLKLNLHDPIYLLQYPYLTKKINPETFLLFLATLNEDIFDFKLKKGLDCKIEGNEVDCRLIITQKSIDLFPEKKVFKLQFDSFGKHFYLQIIGTSHYIRYEEITFKRLRRKRQMYLYTFSFIKDYNFTTPYQIRYPQNLFHRISVIFNNKTTSAEVNQFTAMLFYRYSPFNHKVEIKNQMRQINPSDDLYFIFQNHSGYLLMIEGDGPFVFREKRIKRFCWLHPYYNEFLNKGNAIGLDATFRVLKTYKLCVPQCIINNTGVPLGIATAPSESFALYSLFFETVFQLDNNTFQTLQRKAFISDEHKSFNKLQSVYNIKIYKCIMHLIRSVGTNSTLGFLFKDIFTVIQIKSLIEIN